jgi:hypothetical protein
MVHFFACLYALQGAKKRTEERAAVHLVSLRLTARSLCPLEGCCSNLQGVLKLAAFKQFKLLFLQIFRCWRR